MVIKFSIPGEPKSKARPRFAGHAYTPKETAEYEDKVRWIFKNAARGAFFDKECAVSIHIAAYFSIPKSTSKIKREQMNSGKIRPLKRPDVDNVAKIVMDSCNGLAFYDDAQIVTLIIEKYYYDNPRVDVEISSIDEANSEGKW